MTLSLLAQAEAGPAELDRFAATLVRRRRRVIDLHNHLLPGVDDGSRSVEPVGRVLNAIAPAGRHRGLPDAAPRREPARARESAAHDAGLRGAHAPPHPPCPQLHRGAELMLDRPLPARVAEARQVTLGGTRYVLVEFPRLVTFQAAAAALAHVVEIGLIPVLAHPERYACCTPEAVRRWRALGAISQVDAPTLLRDARPRHPGAGAARGRPGRYPGR